MIRFHFQKRRGIPARILQENGEICCARCAVCDTRLEATTLFLRDEKETHPHNTHTLQVPTDFCVTQVEFTYKQNKHCSWAIALEKIRAV